MITYLQTRFPRSANALEFHDANDSPEDKQVSIPLGELRQLLSEYHDLAQENSALATLASRAKDELASTKGELEEMTGFVEDLCDRHDDSDEFVQ